ncbi:pyruvate dehydrogenase complex dihydrolipoamide acetyltransferase [Amylibacter sp. SFDW26]|uniref:pyruvate dehydrogenase complex dihydrolipoamide acetyltransferase n=1 Tax=Amylibacter sp. SFDW26 TaxID=2652722 RepID=UPI0012614ABF|nr:pyruvate dehydrogenase complex dihydrolipoamide acetyltransferase [Amylibacter sp. SFDW26]KAB7616065.1 pyruvate dehydrogenase complex dihydrolipoamide acetyltransferase [Amylibacter sp. SFDW26]
MAIQILMPALSPTMEEGTLAKWLVKEGDTVQSGDLMAEIETDKATMEFEAVDEGVIGKILVAEGTSGVAVNTAIAVLLEEGEDPSAAETAPPAPTPTTELETVTAEAPKAAAPAQTAPVRSGERVFATPLARRIAADKGVDLTTLSGSGPHGRIIKADVEGKPANVQPSVPVTKAVIASSATSDSVKAMYQDRTYEEVPLDGMRKTIAARLTEAKQTIPHFYLRRSIHLDRLMAARKEMNVALETDGIKISVNDFIIKACAKALQDVPDANAVWAEDRILKLEPSDVAVAVAIEGGLFTPVLRDSDKKSLSELSSEMKDLAGRARERKLAPHEYQGGSFAISNLGMMGIENFDAVINPPHGSILAVGAGMKKPVIADDGTVKTAIIMSVTLSVDHRVVDGALGAEFLGRIAHYLENPLAMFA